MCTLDLFLFRAAESGSVLITVPSSSLPLSFISWQTDPPPLQKIYCRLDGRRASSTLNKHTCFFWTVFTSFVRLFRQRNDDLFWRSSSSSIYLCILTHLVASFLSFSDVGLVLVVFSSHHFLALSSAFCRVLMFCVVWPFRIVCALTDGTHWVFSSHVSASMVTTGKYSLIRRSLKLSLPEIRCTVDQLLCVQNFSPSKAKFCFLGAVLVFSRHSYICAESKEIFLRSW